MTVSRGVGRGGARRGAGRKAGKPTFSTSEYALWRRVYVECTSCGIWGPLARLREHLAIDHAHD